MGEWLESVKSFVFPDSVQKMYWALDDKLFNIFARSMLNNSTHQRIGKLDRVPPLDFFQARFGSCFRPHFKDWCKSAENPAFRLSANLRGDSPREAQASFGGRLSFRRMLDKGTVFVEMQARKLKAHFDFGHYKLYSLLVYDNFTPTYVAMSVNPYLLFELEEPPAANRLSCGSTFYLSEDFSADFRLETSLGAEAARSQRLKVRLAGEGVLLNVLLNIRHTAPQLFGKTSALLAFSHANADLALRLEGDERPLSQTGFDAGALAVVYHLSLQDKLAAQLKLKHCAHLADCFDDLGVGYERLCSPKTALKAVYAVKGDLSLGITHRIDKHFMLQSTLKASLPLFFPRAARPYDLGFKLTFSA